MRVNRMGKAAFSFYKWLGFIVALIVSVISAVLGFIDNTPSQLVMLYTVAIFGSILWGWHHLSVRWTYIDSLKEEDTQLVENAPIQEIQDIEITESYFNFLIKSNKGAIVGILAMIIVLLHLLLLWIIFFNGKIYFHWWYFF